MRKSKVDHDPPYASFALTHLMNFVWPNVFENSPHLIQAFMDAVEGMRVSLGPMKVLSYVVQVNKLPLLW